MISVTQFISLIGAGAFSTEGQIQFRFSAAVNKFIAVFRYDIPLNDNECHYCDNYASRKFHLRTFC